MPSQWCLSPLKAKQNEKKFIDLEFPVDESSSDEDDYQPTQSDLEVREVLSRIACSSIASTSLLHLYLL